jgi:hypothetical protein
MALAAFRVDASVAGLVDISPTSGAQANAANVFQFRVPMQELVAVSTFFRLLGGQRILDSFAGAS